jgi:hypothetical protein
VSLIIAGWFCGIRKSYTAVLLLSEYTTAILQAVEAAAMTFYENRQKSQQKEQQNQNRLSSLFVFSYLVFANRTGKLTLSRREGEGLVQSHSSLLEEPVEKPHHYKLSGSLLCRVKFKLSLT